MTLPIAAHEYVIITKKLVDNTFQVEKYTGKCLGCYAGGIDWVFVNIARVKTPYDVKRVGRFTIWDEYYDLKGIKTLVENAKLARQSMEHRALNMILKKVVNEEFQWL